MKLKSFKNLFQSPLDFIVFFIILWLIFLLLTVPHILIVLSSFVTNVSASSAPLININKYFNVYSLLLGSLLGLILLIVLLNRKVFFQKEIFRNLTLTGILACFFLLGFLQLVAQTGFIFHKLTSHPYGDYQSIINNIHFVKQKFSYCSSFEFRTDLNLEVDPGMFTHRLWRYFLFPLPLSMTNTNQADCIIFFNKHDYASECPKDYVILGELSLSDAVAVRKDLIE